MRIEILASKFSRFFLIVDWTGVVRISKGLPELHSSFTATCGVLRYLLECHVTRVLLNTNT